MPELPEVETIRRQLAPLDLDEQYQSPEESTGRWLAAQDLPPELLLPFIELEQSSGAQRVAIAVDVRSATSLPLVPAQLKELRNRNVEVRPLFLDATTDTLVRRFSETRRRHPLSSSRAASAPASASAADVRPRTSGIRTSACRCRPGRWLRRPVRRSP